MDESTPKPQCIAAPEWNALDRRHHREGIQHAVKRRAADSENLRRSQLVTIATTQYGKYVATYDLVEPPRTQVDAVGGRCGRVG